MLAGSGVVVTRSVVSDRSRSDQMKPKIPVSVGVGLVTCDEQLSQSSDDDEALGLMQKHQSTVGGLSVGSMTTEQ